MDKLLLEIPTSIETERLVLRPYQAGDGQWYFLMSQRNKPHLARYETGNPVMTINTVEEAEETIRGFIEAWTERNAFFMGIFRKGTNDFIGQMYIGVVNWDLPEFEIGYFADIEQEGQGYITEAVKAALSLMFRHFRAHRVRLETDDTNVRSIRVAERSGMLKEGHIRQNKIHPDGSLSGTLFYGLMRSEFVFQESQFGGNVG